MGPNSAHSFNMTLPPLALQDAAPPLAESPQPPLVPPCEAPRITELLRPARQRPKEHKLKFAHDSLGFLTELRHRVDGYFKATGYSKNDCWQMYLKTAIILSLFASSYVLLVFFATTIWEALGLAVVLAVSMALIGFCIQHDGGHHGYSKYKFINKLAGMSLDLIGASSYLWYWKHGIFHHTYCNVQGHDTDIDVSGLARFSPHVKRKKIQHFQHLYLWLLYGLMASRWHVYGDFLDVYNGKIGPHRIARPKGWDMAIFIGGKIITFAMLFAVPMIYHDWWVVLLFYVLVTGMIGIILSVVFQLAHCVEEADFPLPPEGSLHMESAWAVHQVETTVDFARTSWSASWLLGGLNFQIEHHLFPKICHIHYPALSKIVEETCHEFGVRYATHPTFWAGVVSHYRWLKRMGQTDGTPEPVVAIPKH